MSKKLDATKLTLGIKKQINKERDNNESLDQIDKVIQNFHDGHPKNLFHECTKRTTLDIPKALHKKIAQRALDKELYLKDYFLGLAKKDLGIE